MPDSYGTPLWMSPRLRCDRSHAAPIVTNTNPIDTTANPTTYQIAGNRSSLLPPANPVSLGARRYPSLHPVGPSRGRDAARASQRLARPTAETAVARLPFYSPRPLSSPRPRPVLRARRALRPPLVASASDAPA